MKVSELKYLRVKLDDFFKEINLIISQVEAANSANDLMQAHEKYKELSTDIQTYLNLAYMRYTINMADEFYKEENDYYDEARPSIEKGMTDYANAMLKSPYIKDFEQLVNPLVIRSLELQVKAMSPEIMADMIEENKVSTEYSELMAGMMINFNGEEIPRAMIAKYLKDDNREVRKAAYEAYGKKLAEHAEQLDSCYDRLVKIRDNMAKKMGYKNYIELGYARLGRIGFDAEQVATFRKNILKDIVPVVARLKTENAKEMGIDNMMFYDDSVSVKGGDPKPVVDKDGIFAAAKEMYHELSPQTGKFIDMMLENEAFDVEARKNKWGGGYCISFPKYKQPFILANFSGSAADVDVVTHEAGHAFANYMTADNKYAVELDVGEMEIAETHSMSMEFFAWKYIEKFFGENAQKYRFMHAFDALSFLPYGTIVDYFQHIVYENPDMTPAQRNEVWSKLEAEYRPYMSTEGMTFFEEGRRWQYQMHIFDAPFYYIDYCLAQVVAFEFLLESQKDYDNAFKRYVKFLSQGGEKPFEALVKEAGLKSPFENGALKEVAADVEKLIMSLKK